MRMTVNQSINRSIFIVSQKIIVTQWVQAKLDKLVSSLSQLLITYYRVKMNVHQTIKTSRPKADKPLSSRHRVKLHGIVD